MPLPLGFGDEARGRVPRVRRQAGSLPLDLIPALGVVLHHLLLNYLRVDFTKIVVGGLSSRLLLFVDPRPEVVLVHLSVRLL